MKLTISKVAAKWYKKELSMEKQDNIRFFVRYGGVGGIIPGFSLGVKIDKPKDTSASTTVEDVTFFIEQEDEWYFSDKTIKIQMNHKLNEPEFIYS